MSIWKTTVREFFEKMWAGVNLEEGPRFIEKRMLGKHPSSEFHNSLDSFLEGIQQQPKGVNYYYGAHLRDTCEGNRESVSVATTLHADLDFKDKPYREWQEILKDFELPATAVVATGNGLHAYWFLKVPSLLEHDKQKGHFEAVQCGLQKHLGADTTHDLPRILRIPGTVNYKDSETPKQGEIMFADFSRTYFLTQFEKFHPLDGSSNQGPAPPVAGEIPQGGRNRTLTSLAGTMQRRGMAPAAIEKALLEENQVKCNPPMSEKEVLGIVKSICRYEPKEPVTTDPFKKPPTPLNILKLADVESTFVDFLWHPYIPMGKVTLIDGDPGVGKSWLTQALASAVSVGTGLPRWVSESADVLLLAREDGVSDTVRPRLETMDADLEKIFLVEDTFVLNNNGIQNLRRLIQGLRPVLVVIDPLVAYLGSKLDINAANETRSVMSPLAELAEEFHCALVCVRHLRKAGGKRLYQGLGSIDFIGAARSVLHVSFDSESDNVRVIRHVKCNVAATGAKQFYYISDGVFHWGDSYAEV